MTDHQEGVPAEWLVMHRVLLPPAGSALDVACGRGRHSSWLATQGFTVTALDRNPGDIESVNRTAHSRGLAITGQVADLESGDIDLGRERFDVIVAVHYLHRPLFPSLIASLRFGGVLVYETFTRDQALRGKPTNPAFLLEPGELVRLVSPLEVLASREGDFGGRCVASVVARRSASTFTGGSADERRPSFALRATEDKRGTRPTFPKAPCGAPPR